MKYRYNIAAVLLLVGTVAVAAWLMQFLIPQGSTEGAPTAPEVTNSPSEIAVSADPFRITTPDDFSKRVLDFEEAYQMRARPDGLARLAPFASDRYKKDHTSPPGNKYALPSSNEVISVSHDLTKTELTVTKNGQDPNVRYVSVRAFVTTNQGDPPHYEQIHATTWRFDGTWEVDQER